MVDRGLKTQCVSLEFPFYFWLPLMKEVKLLQRSQSTENVVNFKVTKKIAKFSIPKQLGLEKCPLYLEIPRIGKPSINLEICQNRRGKPL